MNRSVNLQRANAWRNRVHEHAQSGLSVKDFCQLNQISTASFYQWKRKLASQDVNQLPATQHAEVPINQVQLVPQNLSSQMNQSQQPAFWQVVEATKKSPTIASHSNGSPWMELTLPGGTIVRLPANHLEALQIVLQNISREGC